MRVVEKIAADAEAREVAKGEKRPAIRVHDAFEEFVGYL
jgi:hypothetical protein